MKTIAFLLTLALALGLTAANLTGCTEDNNDTPKSAVCFVIANTANSNGLNFQSSLVQDTIYTTILHYGHMSVVQADGEPKLSLSQNFDIDEKYKGASKERLTADAKQKSAAVLNVLQTTVAEEPEVDYLQALSLASRTLSSLNGYTSKTVIVLGNCIGTKGVFNFQNNLLSAEPEVIVDMLEEAKEIPSFENMTVVFQHLGEVRSPQEELNGVQKDKLKKIYQQLVERGGGTFVLSDTPAIEVDSTVVFPYVTPIELPTDKPIAFEKEELEQASDDDAFQEPMFLGEHQVGFIGNQANYVDSDKAIEVLEPIAAYLLEHPTVSILLIGTTAGRVNDTFAITLSQERAQKVKETLVALGVPPERLIAIGLGCNDAWHLEDEKSEVAKQANRKVVIIDVRAETAKEILSQQ